MPGGPLDLASDPFEAVVASRLPKVVLAPLFLLWFGTGD